ncbi:MAG: ATP-binding cassette domain-containing protein, partial [Lachnospiraceae bacterium]|nr:ATP-binding cassette domain-containing protein [Lachnospiraceae bacterium]
DAKNLKKGFDTMIFKSFDEDGTELSGGQQQKTAISRALYRNAPIVILDEPTAALDPLAEYEIYKKFDALVGGKSAIYISHRLSSCRFCDHIAVFADKTVKEYGTHDELVHRKDGIYAEMFAAQAQYYVEAAS